MDDKAKSSAHILIGAVCMGVWVKLSQLSSAASYPEPTRVEI